ncbi:MAG: hypothetical protein A3E02_00505 [Candidatus Zambryskibacteria bacterium RIFCSPHIGHO2_12_FULL_38_34]|uniref:SET domain-containing protein-lysine N-methyltransferase n=1 Tax=Candidatus Zambryskibacteria bacterium RIFCSPLOWO2_12_FULL_39_16 TaxID=1802775 RepID=A0A1G2USI8_9BACT|nr:MAG: hypothetical protein A3D37_00800 [Candidatus Zambryskibacteria bacterium RIFCSPHIGHO2_02_FULL_38_22]OHA98366.1 MAG: hypothetical protein A3E02_00505 [Candidatus Zambryskibacteria bacterium RIFCSPHIGHO2_12_FULL_38_34]OHB08379.1 MAG: hypothetical protein A3I19_01165 [Candidatus Zambryskibacteria bacterium RIFCSPLOWO2_02_FULL_38_13]OHB12353.1 MAG: hypothetical protein A3G46_00195 [Candidatus Zambryskibacteria bacterium RIFCSPLOWO2_12_FULL_39_16]
MKHIYHTNSKIDGLGIFAGENIRKGEIIQYIKGVIKFKINKNKEDALANPDWVGVKKNHWIDPERPYKFLNHSCNPSAGIKGKVTMVALRDIKEAEEITVDYSTIEGDDMWEMKCTCGEPNCRGIIKSVQFLPKEQFKKYMPNVPKYFQKVYLNGSKNKKKGVAS